MTAADLNLSYGDRVVLDGVDLHASAGHRVGVIGENGAGKSTLLRLLAGMGRPDHGSIEVVGTVGLLTQEQALTGAVGRAMTRSLMPLHAAVRDIEERGARLAVDPGAADAFADRLEWARAHDAWDADRRATVTLAALGLASLDPDRPAAELSGGQRTRLTLAALLTARPDCLLLDEPTNHLDEPAMEPLEDHLVDMPGLVVAASHDRVFLDRVWQQERIEQRRRDARIDTGRVAHDRGLRDNDKFTYAFKGANVERAHARRVHRAARRLAIAEREAVPRPPAPLRFTGALTRPCADGNPAPDAVRVAGLHIPGRVRVDKLTVPDGGRLLLTGANGSGKSSLLKVLAGQLIPTSGSVVVRAARVGLLEQDVAFPEPTVSARPPSLGRPEATSRTARCSQMSACCDRRIRTRPSAGSASASVGGRLWAS